jgi:hypothetical protein
MNAGSALVITGLIVVAVGVAWLLAGSPGTDTGIPAPAAGTASATPVQNGSPPSGPGVTAAPTQAPAATPSPSPEPTQQLSPDDIKLHFMDLAFGAGNAYLERWNATGTSGRVIVSVSGGSDSDAALLSSAAQEFDSLSQTTQLSSMIKNDMHGDIAFKFIAGEGMDDIALNTSDTQAIHDFQLNGSTIAEVTPGVVYIDAGLEGDQRNHTLMRSLYYELGVTGETQKYPDSLFYAGDNTNVNLTPVDQGAIAILYGPGLSPGMSVDDIRKVMLIQ